MVTVILKEIVRNTASLKLVRFRARIIGAARFTSEMFPHTSPAKRVSVIFQIGFGFFLHPTKL